MSAYEPYPLSPEANRPDPPDELSLASRWRRFWALLLDYLLLIVFAFALGVATTALGASDETGALVAYGIYFLAALLYAPVTMRRGGRHNGQTLGKQLLRVRVVTSEGVPVTFWRSVRRDVLGITLINLVSGGIYAIVDYPFGLFDRRRQTLHDKIGSTFVVRADAGRDVAGLDGGGWEPPVAPRTDEGSDYSEAKAAFGR